MTTTHKDKEMVDGRVCVWHKLFLCLHKQTRVIPILAFSLLPLLTEQNEWRQGWNGQFPFTVSSSCCHTTGIYLIMFFKRRLGYYRQKVHFCYLYNT